jgi:hypothetical protein
LQCFQNRLATAAMKASGALGIGFDPSLRTFSETAGRRRGAGGLPFYELAMMMPTWTVNMAV